MDCPECGATVPDGRTHCPSCGANLFEALGFGGKDLDQDRDRFREDPRVYVLWEGWPWALLGTYTQSRDQFMTRTTLGGVVILLALLALIAVGQVVCALLLAIVVPILLYITWSVGRANARQR